MPLFKVKENRQKTSPISKLEMLFYSKITKLTGITGPWDIKTFLSSDNKVRKAEVRTVKEGTVKVFLRPISEMVVLLCEGQ